jgi:putative FmdB family regulatory protein
MPIFEYRCTSCSHLEELLQKHGDPPPAACPACGKKKAMVKEISLTSFQLKGGGWYKDLYASSTGDKKTDGDGAGTDASKDATKDAAKGDAGATSTAAKGDKGADAASATKAVDAKPAKADKPAGKGARKGAGKKGSGAVGAAA